MSFTNGTTYRFRNKYYSGYALNVYGTNAASTGRNVCLYTNDTSDVMQNWVLKDSEYGYRLHSAVNNNFVLDCSDGSLSNSYANNAHLCAISQTNPDDCVVEFEKVSDNVYKIYLPGHDRYLTATNTELVNGLPASSISNATALIGGTGGKSNVYWAIESTSLKQQWIVSPEVDGDDEGEYDKNYLVYPTKTMNITQNYNDGNHYYCSHGTPVDYPIDEACEDTGRSWFYCPCDSMTVTRVYTAGTNTVWMESTTPVVTPSGTYNKISMMVMHPNDDDLINLNGKTFTRGQAMFREGSDGVSTGNHLHISVGSGSYNGGSWSNGWYGPKDDGLQYSFTPTGSTLKPEQAFYVDTQFTEIVNSKGITFQTL